MDAFWSQVRSKFDFRHLFPAEDEESVRWSESYAKGRQRGQKKEKEMKEAQNGARGKADAKRERKRIKIKPKATKMIQNCSQKATIGYQMGHKRLPKVDLGARVDFLCQKGGSQG
jgi:hypothetical protein